MNPAASCAPVGATHLTHELTGVEAIFDPNVSLVVWQRPASLHDAAADVWPQFPQRYMRSIGARNATPRVIAGELALATESPVANDVAMLCELFATITGATTLGLRVDITAQATCPRFHVDRVMLRLMITYRGPGTEWLDHDGIHQAQRLDVLFAKGESWPDLECEPCQHRSPAPLPGQTRVLMTLDAL
jgi:hypothetical protein